jgi:hypothetical protein
LEFDAMVGRYVGMMPVLADQNGVFRDLIEGEPVQIEAQLAASRPAPLPAPVKSSDS